MPLTPAITAPMFSAALASANVKGQGAVLLAAALASGLQAYATSGMTVITIDVGTTGSGTGVGSGIFLTPPALSSSLIAAFSGSSIVGSFAAPTATAIGIAISQALAQAVIQSVNVGVGVGTGVVQIIPNPGVSVPSFVAAFLAAGLKGQSSALMATAVATGLDAVLPSAKGVIAISGPPSTYPGTGSGKGFIL